MKSNTDRTRQEPRGEIKYTNEGSAQAAAVEQGESGRVLNPEEQQRSCRERDAGDALLGLDMAGAFLPLLWFNQSGEGSIPVGREFSQEKAAAPQWKSHQGPRGHGDDGVPSLGSPVS